MKYWLELEVIALFLALFLTGVDAKATAPDEDKTTHASAWVDQWTESSKSMLEKEHGCDMSTQKNVYDRIHRIVPKVAMFRDSASPDDLASFEQAIFFSKNVAQEEIKQCKDPFHLWSPLLVTLDRLLGYIQK